MLSVLLALGVVADERSCELIAQRKLVAPARRAVKTFAVSRETTGVLRRRHVSRETIGGAVKTECS